MKSWDWIYTIITDPHLYFSSKLKFDFISYVEVKVVFTKNWILILLLYKSLRWINWIFKIYYWSLYMKYNIKLKCIDILYSQCPEDIFMHLLGLMHPVSVCQARNPKLISLRRWRIPKFELRNNFPFF